MCRPDIHRGSGLFGCPPTHGSRRGLTYAARREGGLTTREGGLTSRKGGLASREGGLATGLPVCWIRSFREGKTGPIGRLSTWSVFEFLCL